MAFECLEPRYTMDAAVGVERIGCDQTETRSTPRDSPADHFNRSDVNQDGAITPLDVLIVINALNQNDAKAFSDDNAADYALDVNADSWVSLADVSAVIDDLQHVRHDPPIVKNAGTASVYEDPVFGTVILPIGQELVIRSERFRDRFHTLVLDSATSGSAITGVSDVFQFEKIETIRDPNGICTLCTLIGWSSPVGKEWIGKLDTVALTCDGTVVPIRLHFYGVPVP